MRADALALLHRAPHVARVERTGPRHPPRRVVHVLDYHDLPDDLARADGHDPGGPAKAVDRVQRQQADVSEHLAKPGVKAVHVEGLAEREVPTFKARLDHQVEVAAGVAGLRGKLAELRPGLGADAVRKQIDGMEAEHRADVRRLGVLALLACRGLRLEALALDDEQALERATPKVVGGEVVIDGRAHRERQEAMVRRLPERGLAVIVLGATHDLGPLLGRETEYVQVALTAVSPCTQPLAQEKPAG